MHSTARVIAALLAGGALVASVTACGSTSSLSSAGTASSGHAGSEPSARTAMSGAGQVTVALSEWGLEPSVSQVPAGKLTITAKNRGGTTHELVLFKTALPVESLPLDEEGAVDERAAGVELIDEVEDVAPGASKSFTVDNAVPGAYVLVCNLVEEGDTHYGHKMYAPFTVT